MGWGVRVSRREEDSSEVSESGCANDNVAFGGGLADLGHEKPPKWNFDQ